MGAAPAFSVIGVSNTAGGGGDTENARYNTSVKYRRRRRPAPFRRALSVRRLRSGQRFERRVLARSRRGLRPFLLRHSRARRSKTRLPCPISANFRFPPACRRMGSKRHFPTRPAALLAAKIRIRQGDDLFRLGIYSVRQSERRLSERLHRDRQLSRPGRFCERHRLYEHKILRIFWTGVKYAFGTTSTSPAPTIITIRTTTIRAPARMAGCPRRAAAARSTPIPP